jgi:hypothetical protein
VFVGAAIAAFIWFVVVSQGFAATDESWFLQVIDRVQSGDTLYRDVYFNTTPLSVYVALGLTSLFGTELLVIRVLVASALVATVVFCWLICRLVGAGRYAPWLLVSSWAQAAPYTPLAMAFFAASFYATVSWVESARENPEGRRWLASAAAAAGLCFAAKPNLGVYCLAAVLISVAVARPGRVAARRAVVTVLAAFFSVAFTIVLPVYLSGGAGRLLLHGLDKTTYLDVGAVPYSAVLERFRVALADRWSFDSVAAAYREFAFLLPPAAAVLLAAACLRFREHDRKIALVVTSFVSAGYLVVYPGQGGSSNIYAIPVLIVGVAYGLRALRSLVSSSWIQFAAIALTVLFAGQLGLRYARYTSRLILADHVTSDLPHFHGIRARGVDHLALKEHVESLSTLASGKPLFLIGPNTGFYYLAAGITNPDRFDFPYTTVFGRTGQQQVISRIRAGEIPSVFIFSEPMFRQTPSLLQEFVQTSMSPVRRQELGVLYQATNEH